MNFSKSIKVEKNKYRVPIPKRRFAINVSDSLCITNHKNRWVVALCYEEGNGRMFHGNQTLNRSQAIKLISFLADYVNLVKPTEATAIQASIKASVKMVTRKANELTGIAIKSENEND